MVCPLHFKDVLCRKLISLNIPREIVSKLMAHNGLMNILFIIPIDDIEKKGTRYFLCLYISIHKGFHTFDIIFENLKRDIPTILTNFGHILLVLG